MSTSHAIVLLLRALGVSLGDTTVSLSRGLYTATNAEYVKRMMRRSCYVGTPLPPDLTVSSSSDREDNNVLT